MAIARSRSVVTLPRAGTSYASVLDFLVTTFAHVPRATWEQRVREGKVLDASGAPVAADAAYAPGKRIYYFREVDDEPVIPFAEQILFQSDELLVADKPHFLPVIPGGRFVNECLLNRLRHRTGIESLAPLHRLDRETAGLVAFSVNPQTRGHYHDLFMHGVAEKIYYAVATAAIAPVQRRWTVENRIVRGEPRFRMRTVPGTPNARSTIELEELRGSQARFRLWPHTGKTHQLRVHMAGLGFPIVNDRCYPELLPEAEDDFGRPLQLLAKSLRFCDPVSGKSCEFVSARELTF
jgi:tRNA pseudouridine32 synthase / 23S rRNA pseudouridine746 synthase